MPDVHVIKMHSNGFIFYQNALQIIVKYYKDFTKREHKK